MFNAESQITNATNQKIFSEYLREILIQRCKQNSAYSLRAFAKQLGIEASHLSKIIANKRTPSPKLILRLAMRLSLSPQEVDRYIKNSNPRKSNPLLNQTSEYHNLTVNQFMMISDWYHYAILELIELPAFQHNEAWIAKALGIQKIQVTDAIARMVRLEILSIDANKKITKQTESLTTVQNPFTTSAFRKLQRQILDQAIVALEEVPLEKRDQSSMTVAIDTSLIPEAKERIKKFRRSLAKFLKQNESTSNEVYQISVALFPVTQITKKVPSKSKGVKS